MRPRNTKRNDKLIRLRDKNPKRWSWAQLGKKFGVNRYRAREIYKAYKPS